MTLTPCQSIVPLIMTLVIILFYERFYGKFLTFKGDQNRNEIMNVMYWKIERWRWDTEIKVTFYIQNGNLVPRAS